MIHTIFADVSNMSPYKFRKSIYNYSLFTITKVSAW